MSHFTTIDVVIRDIDALSLACDELDLGFAPNAVARGFDTNEIEGDFVITLNGPYDIAVQKEHGAYTLVADLWQGHVEAEVGENFGKLKQLYGVHATMLQAKSRGLSVRRHNQQNGRVRLAIGGAA